MLWFEDDWITTICVMWTMSCITFLGSSRSQFEDTTTSRDNYVINVKYSPCDGRRLVSLSNDNVLRFFTPVTEPSIEGTLCYPNDWKNFVVSDDWKNNVSIPPSEAGENAVPNLQNFYLGSLFTKNYVITKTYQTNIFILIREFLQKNFYLNFDKKSWVSFKRVWIIRWFY